MGQNLSSVIQGVTATGKAKSVLVNADGSLASQSQAGNKFTNIAANGTAADIMTGPGVLVGVSVNKPGASANVLTLYNSLTGTGTKIGTFDATVAGYTPLNVTCDVGLTAVLATGTAADITLTWHK